MRRSMPSCSFENSDSRGSSISLAKYAGTCSRTLVATETRAQLLGHGFQPHEQIVYLLEITRTGVGERESTSTTRKQRQAELRFRAS